MTEPISDGDLDELAKLRKDYPSLDFACRLHDLWLVIIPASSALELRQILEKGLTKP